MRRELSVVFGVLAFLTLAAFLLDRWREQAPEYKLVWVSDSNPERSVQVEAFNTLHPELSLKLDTGNLGMDKVLIQASSGVGPDLFDSYSGQELEVYAESGVAWDVSGESTGSTGAALPPVWEAVEGELRFGGRPYGYPANVSVDLLIFNKAIFDRLGVEYPKEGMSWAELFSLAKRLTQIHERSRETVWGINGLTWKTFFESLGGEYFSEDGTRLLLTGPLMSKAFELHLEIRQGDPISPTLLEVKNMSAQGGFGGVGATGLNINAFAAGRFAMMVAGQWSRIALRRAMGNTSDDEGLCLGAVTLPRFEKLPPRYGVRARVTSINSRSPRREDALQFLSFLGGPVYSRLINRSGDGLPGNPHYASEGMDPAQDAPDAIEFHGASLRAMLHGYVPRTSPFLLTFDVSLVLQNAIDRLESNPRLGVEGVLADAQFELERLMERNLAQNPGLRERYQEALKRRGDDE